MKSNERRRKKFSKVPGKKFNILPYLLANYSNVLIALNVPTPTRLNSSTAGSTENADSAGNVTRSARGCRIGKSELRACWVNARCYTIAIGWIREETRGRRRLQSARTTGGRHGATVGRRGRSRSLFSFCLVRRPAIFQAEENRATCRFPSLKEIA
ncbi:hypothetical protein PUN28_003441 [Cardiocondyla obscurior]|uniref:Uncharacterized protein n=1 Tax=Cardiocondyla obscurior TaxID=286306 RepID=A0AAW2GJ10_9HYME